MPVLRDPRLDYLDALVETVPRPCHRALDVGCGEGEFARRLAPLAEHVIGIDRSAEMVAAARALTPDTLHVDFVHGELLAHPFGDGEFDCVVAVASLHHIELDAALAVMRRVLRPGGTLAILGLARDSSPLDYLRSAVALGVGALVRAPSRGEWRSPLAIGPSKMPLHDPQTTYREVREAAQRRLPGARFTRHLFFRYSLVWEKPLASEA